MKDGTFRICFWREAGGSKCKHRRVIACLLTFSSMILCASLSGISLDLTKQGLAEDAATAVSDKFNVTCGVCHPAGGNTFKPHLALNNAPQLEDINEFLSYIRSPAARDGSQTMMPPFTGEALSDEEAKAIYEYIVKELKGQ